MNETRNTTSSTQNASGFQWPSPTDFAFICASALMPYLAACILLAL